MDLGRSVMDMAPAAVMDRETMATSTGVKVVAAGLEPWRSLGCWEC